MDYSYLDLLCYLLIYAFLGWVTEVLVISIKDRKLRNRGFFNLPFCLSYGVIMDILIIVIPTMIGNDGAWLMMYLASVAVSSVVMFLSGSLSKRMSTAKLWEYEEHSLFSGEARPFLYGLLIGALFLIAVLLVHPLIFLFVTLLPKLLKRIACLIIVIMLCSDLALILATMRRRRTPEELEALLDREQANTRRLSERISSWIWRRVYKAYPNISHVDIPEKAVFAEGLCFDKLVWVWVFMAVGGCLFEVFFVWLTTGNLMSRASLIYGPFSVVWGFGSVFLTVVLQRIKHKEDRYLFFAGFFLGGIYEYSCSVISEVVFGTVFWDYSDMPFNFGGRTNLLFCMFWGIVSVWWVKWMYPRLSSAIEKIPPIVGKVVTWVVLALLALDCLISAAALWRYVDRLTHPEASNILIRFLDQTYPNSYLDKVWENLRLTG